MIPPLYIGKELEPGGSPGKQDKTAEKVDGVSSFKAGRFPEALNGGRGLDAMTF